jgi:IS5 family transposase
MKQITLSTSNFDRYVKTTRGAAFLAEMDRVVPWSTLCALVEPFYPKAGTCSTFDMQLLVFIVNSKDPIKADFFPIVSGKHSP